jgi:hypothetical protein
MGNAHFSPKYPNSHKAMSKLAEGTLQVQLSDVEFGAALNFQKII